MTVWNVRTRDSTAASTSDQLDVVRYRVDKDQSACRLVDVARVSISTSATGRIGRRHQTGMDTARLLPIEYVQSGEYVCGYVRYLRRLSSDPESWTIVWTDTGTVQLHRPKVYVVQTNDKGRSSAAS